MSCRVSNSGLDWGEERSGGVGTAATAGVAVCGNDAEGDDISWVLDGDAGGRICWVEEGSGAGDEAGRIR